jgi:hypothetical protein
VRWACPARSEGPQLTAPSIEFIRRGTVRVEIVEKIIKEEREERRNL